MKSTTSQSKGLSRRQLLKILAASGGALVLAKCAPPTQPTAAPTVATAVPQATAAPIVATAVPQPTAAPNVTVTFWRPPLGPVISTLEKARTTFYEQTMKDMLPKNVSVNTVEVPGAEYVTKLQSSVVAGNPPDVTYMDQGMLPAFLGINGLRPMPEDLIDIKAAYDPIVNDLFRFGPDKKVYNLPVGWFERGLYYNVGLLKQYGYSPKDVPSKLADMISFCQKLTIWPAGATEPKLAALPLGGGTTFDFWTAVITNLGGWWFLDATTTAFDQPEWEEAWGLTLDMFDKFKLDTRVGTNALDRFYAGNAVFLPQQNWVGGVLQVDHPAIEWGLMNIPTPKGGPPYGWKEAATLWGVTSVGNDLQLNASWQLFKALNSPEWDLIEAQRVNFMPARVELLGKPPFTVDNPHFAGVVEKHLPGNSVSVGSFTAEFSKLFNDAWTNVYTNNANLHATLQQAKKDADAFLVSAPENQQTIITKAEYVAHPDWSGGKVPIKPWWDGKPRSYLNPDQR